MAGMYVKMPETQIPEVLIPINYSHTWEFLERCVTQLTGVCSFQSQVKHCGLWPWA